MASKYAKLSVSKERCAGSMSIPSFNMTSFSDAFFPLYIRLHACAKNSHDS